MHGVLRHLLVEGLCLYHDAVLEVDCVLLHDMNLRVCSGNYVRMVAVDHADLLNFVSESAVGGWNKQ